MKMKIREDKSAAQAARKHYYNKNKEHNTTLGRKVWSNLWVTEDERKACQLLIDSMREDDGPTYSDVLDAMIVIEQRKLDTCVREYNKLFTTGVNL